MTNGGRLAAVTVILYQMEANITVKHDIFVAVKSFCFGLFAGGNIWAYLCKPSGGKQVRRMMNLRLSGQHRNSRNVFHAKVSCFILCTDLKVT